MRMAQTVVRLQYQGLFCKYFAVCGVKQETQVVQLLSGWGIQTYTLKNLVAPKTPKDMLDAIREALTKHFKPESLVITEWFMFHK